MAQQSQRALGQVESGVSDALAAFQLVGEQRSSFRKSREAPAEAPADDKAEGRAGEQHGGQAGFSRSSVLGSML